MTDAVRGELLQLNHALLQSVVTPDWATYAKLCDAPRSRARHTPVRRRRTAFQVGSLEHEAAVSRNVARTASISHRSSLTFRGTSEVLAA